MSDLQLLLAQSQAHAFHKPFASFGRTALEELTSDSSGRLNLFNRSLTPIGCAGEMRREDTIRADPSTYCSATSVRECLDSDALAHHLQALRIRALASSYLSPSNTSGAYQLSPDFSSPHTRQTISAWSPSSDTYGSATSSPGRTTSRNTNKKQASQKVLADKVKRTIYICDIRQQVTEEQLATCFQKCGQVVDCRICGDPNSPMRFAFIEFLEEAAVQNALARNGILLGSYPLRVLPSKTAIVPVNNQYLPKTLQERELCGRTIYAANIDKKVDRTDVQTFFESLCGPVSKLRLLGDYHHPTRIAFVEFRHAESARAALNCSGALLGSLPVRVSPSKTPVRPDPRHNDCPTAVQMRLPR